MKQKAGRDKRVRPFVDVLGIVALTIITSMAETDVSIVIVLLKIVLFFAAGLAAGLLLHKLFDKWFGRSGTDKRRYIIVAFAFCLLYAYAAEEFFGVADITGAYIAGLILSKTPKITYLKNRFETLSYILLSPIFFASIGLKVEVPEMSGSIVLFAVLLMVVAIVTKIIGCGLGAKLCRYSNKDALRIGVGMISRGEVALIVANKGISSGIMKAEFFGPVVIVVIVTTIITPILLKFVYRGKEDYSELVESKLVDSYEEAADFDLAAQKLLDAHENMRGKQ